MRLRTFALILSLALGLLAAPVPAEGQKAGKTYRIGVLSLGSSPSAKQIARSPFRLKLRELGWVEGRNYVFEGRHAEGKPARLSALAAELARLKVDVIFTIGTPVTSAAVSATKTIPIVFAAVADPTGSGFVASLARPGRNVTGLSSQGVDVSAKRLQLLKEAVPMLSRAAVLWNPITSYGPLALKEMEVAAPSMGVQLQILRVRGPDEFDSAFAAMTRDRADALLVLSDPMLFFHRMRLADLAMKHRLPTMHALKAYVDAGGLMAYAVSLPALYQRAATYVDKILKGAKPSDIPVEQPTKFELTINLKTAKTLGLTIPDSVLFQADRVIR
ncbi:MAG: ABC transporter substrate-binding protein [Nitrospiraceae bacterium]